MKETDEVINTELSPQAEWFMQKCEEARERVARQFDELYNELLDKYEEHLKNTLK